VMEIVAISKQAHQESNVAGKLGTEPPIALRSTALCDKNISIVNVITRTGSLSYRDLNPGGIGCGSVPLKRLVPTFLNSTNVNCNGIDMLTIDVHECQGRRQRRQLTFQTVVGDIPKHIHAQSKHYLNSIAPQGRHTKWPSWQVIPAMSNAKR
jgi:hypothetical protein